MNENIYLKDNKELALQLCLEWNEESKYKKDNVLAGLEAVTLAGLRYNRINGTAYFESEVMAEYSHEKDIPEYDNLEDLVSDQFVGFIMNSASRIERGHSAI